MDTINWLISYFLGIADYKKKAITGLLFNLLYYNLLINFALIIHSARPLWLIVRLRSPTTTSQPWWKLPLIHLQSFWLSPLLQLKWNAPPLTPYRFFTPSLSFISADRKLTIALVTIDLSFFFFLSNLACVYNNINNKQQQNDHCNWPM